MAELLEFVAPASVNSKRKLTISLLPVATNPNQSHKLQKLVRVQNLFYEPSK